MPIHDFASRRTHFVSPATDRSSHNITLARSAHKTGPRSSTSWFRFRDAPRSYRLSVSSRSAQVAGLSALVAVGSSRPDASAALLSLGADRALASALLSPSSLQAGGGGGGAARPGEDDARLEMQASGWAAVSALHSSERHSRAEKEEDELLGAADRPAGSRLVKRPHPSTAEPSSSSRFLRQRAAAVHYGPFGVIPVAVPLVFLPPVAARLPPQPLLPVAAQERPRRQSQP